MGRFSSPSSPCFTTKSESRGTDLRSRHRVELSRRSAKLTEELLNLVGERGGLLHGREMEALFHLGPKLNIGVGLFSNCAWRHNYFLGESCVTSRDIDRLIR